MFYICFIKKIPTEVTLVVNNRANIQPISFFLIFCSYKHRPVKKFLIFLKKNQAVGS